MYYKNHHLGHLDVLLWLELIQVAGSFTSYTSYIFQHLIGFGKDNKCLLRATNFCDVRKSCSLFAQEFIFKKEFYVTIFLEKKSIFKFW